MATKHQFLLFDDRKFVDISTTVGNQLFNSKFKLLEWADFISATALYGLGCIEGLRQAIQEKEQQDRVGIVLLAESSTRGSFANGSYTEHCVKLAKEHPETVLGFLSTQKLTEDDETDLLTFATDIDLARMRDGYKVCQTPEEAIRKGVDVIFVGKGILQGTPLQPRLQVDQWKQLATEYQHIGWIAYEKILAEQSVPIAEQPNRQSLYQLPAIQGSGLPVEQSEQNGSNDGGPVRDSTIRFGDTEVFRRAMGDY